MTLVLNSLPRRLLFGGALLIVLAVILGLFNPAQFFRSYLFAFVLWLGMSLGAFGLLMLHHLVGGRWGFPVRRIFEACVRIVPWIALAALPVLLGLRHLYSWASPANVAASEILQRKSAYLNPPFFCVRVVVFFSAFVWMMSVLQSRSSAQDETPDPEPTRRLRRFSGPGVVLFFVIATFLNIDLVLSLEAEWRSTIYAAILIIGNATAVLAFSIMLLHTWQEQSPFFECLTPDVWHQLGNLLLAFVMLWAYLAFSQLLIIWSGNLPKEIVWYLHRSQGGWKAVAFALALTHFFVPFFLLLSRRIKRHPALLARVAALVLVGHFIDVYWLVEPSFSPRGVSLHLQDVLLLPGLGALWGGAFLLYYHRRPKIPLHDPRFTLLSAL